MKAVFFDFDGTLRRGDSILSCMAYALKKRRMSPADLMAAAGAGILYALKRISVETLKERCLRFEKRMDDDALERFARGFTADCLMPGLLPEGLRQWRRLKAGGTLTVLVSASTSDYMIPLGEALGADDVICTEMKDRRVLKNCRGQEKADRVRSWAAQRKIDLKTCGACGNSRGDLEMLALVGSPLVIDPGRKMLKTAREKGYPVESWRKT